MGYFDEVVNPNLRLPKVSKALERQIGAFFIAWATLENELDTIFPILFRTDPTVAVSLYANLGTQNKIDSIMSAIEAHRLMLGARVVQSAHRVFEKTKDLVNARNTLAHFRILPFYDGERPRTDWRITRLLARKQPSWTFHPTAPKHWARLTRLVISNAQAIRRKSHALHEQLKKFDADDVQQKAIIHEKEAQLILPRRRKRQSPKKGGFRAGRTNP